MTRTERAQRETDYHRGLADQRETLRYRFACQDYSLPRIPQPPSFEKLTSFSDFFQEREAKKEQIEREEKQAFCAKYNYPL